MFGQSSTELSSMNFVIYEQSERVAKVTVPLGSTVRNLVFEVKRVFEQLGYESQNIICLESLANEEVIDHSLLIGNFEVDNYQDYSEFSVVYGQAVYSESVISLNDFEFKKCLGQGASAMVYLVRHKGNGKLYALKQIEKNYFVEFKRMEQVLRERRIMIEIANNFPFIAKLYASFESHRHLNFLLEFYPGGEMFYHLSRKRLTENEAKLYFAEMVLSLEFLHQNQIIYRDLKPENIMIDFNGHAKLTDFGLCKINLSKDDLATSYCGSVEYMAPEVRENQGYSFSADFYTLGAYLFEMIVGVPPYYNTQSLNFPFSVSPGFRSLVEDLITHSVEDRISDFKAIKQSAWMRDIDWSQVYKSMVRMPYEISVSKTYIHEEFKEIEIGSMNVSHFEDYERLFSFFTFIKLGRQNESFAQQYPSIEQTKEQGQEIQSEVPVSEPKQSIQKGTFSKNLHPAHLQAQPEQLTSSKDLNRRENQGEGIKSCKSKCKLLKGSKDKFPEVKSTHKI